MISSSFSKIKRVLSALRPTEKLVFAAVSVVFLISAFILIKKANDFYSVELPARGGTYKEGIVGYARFINPLLAYTDADKDMISLVYSGLLKPTPEGKFAPDLATSYTVSDDGLTYDVTLKDNIFFHDNTPITADDVIFTIEKARDPLLKSPRAENWSGVTVEAVNDKEIKFTLKKPYAPFLENLTLGILPKHLWENVPTDAFDVNTLNREPVGSGPYKIKTAHRNDSGIYEYYDLIPFDKYALGQPFISHVVIDFYKNENDALAAYKDGEIDAVGGIEPADATLLRDSGDTVISAPLPRVFALFLNQSEAPVLVNKEVRQALDISIDRNALINGILQGWGDISKSPIPRGLSPNSDISPDQSGSPASTTDATEVANISDEYIQAGRKILTDKGWKLNANNIFEKQVKDGGNTSTVTLQFSISTSNIPELKRTAEILRDTWTKLGADVKVEIFEPSDLAQKVIRPRKYDSLLFGNVVGRDLDLYPFWHSSQRNDPGLNIARYTNIKADKALETIRNTSDEAKRQDAYKTIESEIQSDVPAIFLYSPDYIYATNKSVQNLLISNITSPSERFMNIGKWYMNTKSVWKVFARQDEDQK